jgi:hypothetical protein
MVQYTNPELTDMVLIYGKALSNAEAVRSGQVHGHEEIFPIAKFPLHKHTFVTALTKGFKGLWFF